MADILTTPIATALGDGRLTRGLRIRSTAPLLNDKAESDRLLQTIFALELTDVYLYIKPDWYADKTVELAAINAKLNAVGLRVWALYGHVSYLLTIPDTDRFIADLTKLGDYNDSVPSGARFYGFQVEIELQDTPGQETGFHTGKADSKLSPEDYIQRGVLLHQWLNLLTRSANLVHSYDMKFGSAIPRWLNDYEGEPVTMLWAGGKTCLVDLVMPILDEYTVVTQTSVSEMALRRSAFELQYASENAIEGKEMPKVIVGLATDTADDGSNDMAGNLSTMNSLVERYHTPDGPPAFGGVSIDDWGV